MISERVMRYCKDDLFLIENYKKALNDAEVWDCHHRLETHDSDGRKRLLEISRKELIKLNMYWDRPANELIFLTREEHYKLHQKNFMAKSKTLESLNKISKEHIGRKWFNNGIKQKYVRRCPEGYVKGMLPISEETRFKISLGNKGKKRTVEQRKHYSEATKGRKLNDLWKMRLSISVKNSEKHKNACRSEEFRRKSAEVNMGRKWFNDGKREIFQYECPEGFVLGRLRR